MNLSVVIPAYNCADTIGQQLRALSEQVTSYEFEVIVADNGSRDDTRRVVESYKDRLPELRIVDASTKRGAGHARNAGVAAAGSGHILFCDADDEVAQGWIEAMGNALQRHDFVACRLEAEKLSDPGSLEMRHCPQQDGLQSYDYPPFLPHAATAGLGIKKSVHEAVGGFDEDFYKLQDTDYCWRVQLHGVRLEFVPDALVHMRFRNDLRATCRQARQWGEYNVRLYKKYRPHGMPRIPLRRVVREWYGLLRRVHHLMDRQHRYGWLWHFNWLYGRLMGSVRCRIFAL